MKRKLNLRSYLSGKRISLKIPRIIILGIITLIVPSACFLYCLWSYSHISPGADIKEMNEYNKTALQINLDTTNSLANLTIGLAGGIWVLLFTTNKLPKIKGGDLIPFVGGSLSLIFSYTCYRLGLSQYAEMLFGAETVDLAAGFIRYWPIWQMTFFGFGFLVLVLALYHIYRRD